MKKLLKPLINTVILSSTLIVLPLAAQAQGSLIDRANQHPVLGKSYSFDIKLISEDLRAQAYVDPNLPAGQRISVINPPKSEWSSDFSQTIQDFDTDPTEGFWCSDFLKNVGSDVRRVKETKQAVTFAFSPQPESDDDESDRKFLSNMIAHITIDRRTARIQKFAMRNTKSFKPFVFGKIKSFSMKVTCEPGPDERTYAAKLVTEIEGKVALKKFKQHESRTISNVGIRRKSG